MRVCVCVKVCIRSSGDALLHTSRLCTMKHLLTVGAASALSKSNVYRLSCVPGMVLRNREHLKAAKPGQVDMSSCVLCFVGAW